MARVMKSKCYLDASLFNVQQKSSDSWIWKGWMHARSIVWEGRRASEDGLLWGPESHGRFTVSSAYRIAKRFEELNTGKIESSRLQQHKRNTWKRIWGLAIKSELKNFVWKLYYGWLGVNSHLVHRGMSVDSTCKVLR